MITQYPGLVSRLADFIQRKLGYSCPEQFTVSLLALRVVVPQPPILRVGYQQVIIFSQGIEPVTAPGILRGVIYVIHRPHRIKLDIAVTG